MITLASLIGLAGCGLVPANLVLSTSRVQRLHKALRGGLLLGLMLVAFIPIGGLPLGGYLRGITGDFSITTWMLLAGACLSRVMDRELYSFRSKAVLMFLIATGGVFLYPMALGLTAFDPYILGFGSRPFLVVLFVLALWAVRRELYFINLCLIASVLAHTMGLLESRNLWDYLIDPWVTLYAIGFLTRWWWRARRKRMCPSVA
jgi:hypothetical protein